MRRDLAPHEQRERHPGVDVSAAHMPEEVDHREDDEAERQRDRQPVPGTPERTDPDVVRVVARGLLAEDERLGDRPRSNEHEEEDADRLGDQLLGIRELVDTWRLARQHTSLQGSRLDRRLPSIVSSHPS
jgi:hypothetical protein